MFEDLSNPALLAGVLFCGCVIGLLVGCGAMSLYWQGRMRDLKNNCKVLAEQVRQLTPKRPINLDGDPAAYRQVNERA